MAKSLLSNSWGICFFKLYCIDVLLCISQVSKEGDYPSENKKIWLNTIFGKVDSIALMESFDSLSKKKLSNGNRSSSLKVSVFQLRINLLKYHIFIYYLRLYFFC